MTKNNVPYVLIILIIMITGTFICYAIAEFNGTVIHDHEEPWNPIANDAYDLQMCLDKCEKAYDTSLSKRSVYRWRRCRTLCRKLNKCIKWCNEESVDEEASKICIEENCKKQILSKKSIRYRWKK
ncbi:hypothetical protein PIB30_005882 [Stylosanthes scabra]|uniref:Transmembrane protein n=1 Tax=Stylosanthes scabra TaxID=79078 RepID=A0ABU6Q436_9FABA|nr:hypothetical protein [Stylosanthes scabra]